jgi:4-amino-4-deoxy-L-arabinose transferase-like glycosyltransferase
VTKFSKSDLAAITAILLISLIYWFGISAVPFHPDESTQMYMAADLKTALTHPQDLFWLPVIKDDQRMIYREIDPPLTRYLIGLGLAVSGQAPLSRDWDWSATMQQNQENGSFPSISQLLASRLAVASLFPFSLLFAYLIGKRLRGPSLGWLNMGLLAVNAAVLLHTRRAMAESALLAGVLFTLWAVIAWKRWQFLLALPAALAFNAKYSTLPLALIGLAAIFWDYPTRRTSIYIKILHSFLYAALFAALTILLNPFLWRMPIPALQDAFTRRQELIEAQTRDFSLSEGNQVLETFGERAEAILAQLFLGPPAIQEAKNYDQDLAPSTAKYLANPLHRFLTGWIGGSISLFIALSGLVLLLIWIIRVRPISRTAILIFASFLLQLAAIFAMIRLPFQRYYIPLVPYIAMFIAYGLDFSLHFVFYRKRGK